MIKLKVLSNIVVVLFLLLAPKNNAVAQTATQSAFIKELKALAQQRKLKFVAQLPIQGFVPESVDLRHSDGSWQSSADRFAIRWKATYEVFAGFMLVGRQYAGTQLPNDSVPHSAPDKTVIKFLKELTEPQKQLVKQRANVPLSILSPVQIEQLNEMRQQMPVIEGARLTPQTEGFLRLRIVCAILVTSNGRPIGLINAVTGLPKIQYEAFEDDEASKFPAFSTSKVNIKNNVVGVLDFLQAAAHAIDPKLDLKLNNKVDSTALISTDSTVLSSDVTEKFIADSLDLQVRSVGSLIYVVSRGTLLSERIEIENAGLAQELHPTFEAIAKNLGADSNALWILTPSLFPPVASRYQFDLPAETRRKIKAVDPVMNSVMNYSKVAFGSILFFVPVVFVLKDSKYNVSVALPISLAAPKAAESVNKQILGE